MATFVFFLLWLCGALWAITVVVGNFRRWPEANDRFSSGRGWDEHPPMNVPQS